MGNEFWSTLNKKKKEELLKSALTQKQTGKSTAVSDELKTSDFWSALSPEKQEEVLRTSIALVRTFSSDDDDIAPVREKGGKKDSWIKSGGFSDGVDGVGDFIGDYLKTSLGSAADLHISAVKGAGRMVEGLVDLGTYGVAGVADLLGADEFAEKAKKVARYSATDEWTKDAQNFVDQYSIWGNKADSVGEGLGQIAAILLTGGAAGAAGLGGAAVTGITTGVTGLSSMGTNMGEAYDSGATDGDAFLYGLTTGAIEAGTELLFGGLGKGVKALGISRGIGGLDDIFAKKLSSKIVGSLTNEGVQKALGNTIEFAVKSSGEGVEEVLSGLGSAVMKKLTYEDDESLRKLIKDENLLEQFVVGAVTSSIAQGGDFVKATKSGTDLVTGQTSADEKVVNKVVEEEIAQREAKGEKLSIKDKNKIYDDVVERLEKGQIDLDTIDSMYGGEEYKAYKDTVTREDALRAEYDGLGSLENPTLAQQTRYKELHESRDTFINDDMRNDLRKKLDDKLAPIIKDSKLAESYREDARSRQKLDLDVSRYEGVARKTVENAIRMGANNTANSRSFVEFSAKISEDTGLEVDYGTDKDFEATRAKLDVDRVNESVSSTKITLNTDSEYALNDLLGHAISHKLEKEKHYAKLQKAYKDFIGEDAYNALLLEKSDTYKNAKGSNADNEITATLSGKYLFTDEKFIKKLSVEHQDVFHYVLNEIKHWIKMATAGSKEARQLEQIQHLYLKCYREAFAEKKAQGQTTSTATANVKTNITENNEAIAPSAQNNPSTALDKAVADYVENEIDGVKTDLSSFKEAQFFAGKRKAYVRQLSDGRYESGVEGTQGNGQFVPNDNVIRTDTLEEALEAQYRYMLENGGEEGSRMIQKHADKYDEAHTNYALVGKNADGQDVYVSSPEVMAMSMADRIKKFRNDFLADFRGRTAKFERNGHTYYARFVESMKGLGKFAYEGKSKSSPSGLKAKIRLLADGNIFELVEDSTYYDSEKERGKQTQAHKNAEYWDYYYKTVVVDGKGYDVYIDIRNDVEAGDYQNKEQFVYSIRFEDNKNVATSVTTPATQNSEVGVNLDATTEDIIPQNSEKSSGDGENPSSEQEKGVDNKTQTEDSDETFSLSKSVEETKDLMALHNMKADELLKTLELGGLPMPSIAVIKAQQGHEKYGDVSLIFPKHSIDPQASRDNKIYGGDAWTPVYPRIEYKANEAVQERVRTKYYDLAEKYGYDAVRPLYRYAHELESALNSEQGEANLLDWLYKDTKLMQIYLEDSGKGKVEDIVKETRTEASESDKQMSQWFIDKLGEDFIRAFKTPKGESPLSYRKNYIEEHKAEIASAWESFCREVFQITEEQVQNVMRDTNSAMYMKFMRDAEQYLNNGGVTIKTETDYDATERAIEEKAADGYKEWVDSLFKGAEEKTGIRNDKDAYTSSGNRRSWDALHWENTLENVVKAMKAQDQTGADAFSPASAIFAVAHKRYNSIGEVKSDSNRLGRVSEDEYKAMEGEYASRLAEIAKTIQDPNERNPFVASDRAAQEIIDAVRNYKTKAGMLRYMQKWNSRVTESTVDDILSLVSDIANMPTGYFEAKPQRAVSLEEVGVFVIPRNADVKLKQELLNRGYSIAEYDPDVDGDRQKVVNQFEQYKFSLSDVGKQGSGDMPAPIGNYYVYGKDIKYTPDIAPVGEVTSDTVRTSEAPSLENIPVLPDEELADGTIERIRPKPAEQPSLKKINTASSVERVAQVLTEEPKVEKKKQNIVSKAIANFVDKGAAVENLSLKTKNRALQDTYKAIGRSETKAQYFMENGTEGVKPLDAIRAEVEKTGKVQEFYNYIYHKHNIDRMNLEAKERPNLERLTAEMGKLKLLNLQENQLRAIASEKITKETSPKRAKLIKTVQDYLASKDVKNKPVFGYSVTSEVSQNIVNEYEKKNPDFKRYAQDVYDNMNHLRKMMVYNGIISQETADLWAEMYPYYVPIRRTGHNGEAVNVPLDTNKTGINAPIKGATGGNSDILPLFETMAQRTIQTFKAIDKNRFGVELMETLGGVTESTKTNIDEVLDSIDAHDDLLQKGKNGANPTFTVFEGGERVTFEITDELYDAMKPTSEGLSYTFKPLNTASNLHRGLLTEYSVPFMVKNAIKDTQDVLINSQHPARTYANFPTAIKELTTKGKWYAEYMENGGGDNTYFDKQTNTFTKEKSALRKIVGFPFDKISEANNFIERIPRLAEYIASRKNGASVDAAMLDAARVTTDFSAGGDVTKFLDRNGATFLNASVQGFAQQVRNVREAKMNGLKGWLGLAAKCARAGLPAVLLNGLLWEDDEEYEELSDYVKENYYVVAKYGDGKFVRIPKGRTLAVIQNGFEQIGNALTGNDEADFGRFFELFLSNLAPNNPLDNNIIAPIKQVMENKTWYGDDLVPTRLQDLPAAEQYDESTDAISKWLGENLNVSPYKINYLLNQYSGGVGDILLPMFTPEAESGDDSFVGNIIAPLKDKFTTDSVMNNQNISDFYDTADELTANANSSYSTDEDVLSSKYINSVKAEISNLYKAKREIQNSNLSDKLKYQQVREIQKQIVSLAKNGLASYDGVIVDGNHATVGDRHYKLNDDGEWQKINEEQVEKQLPFAKIYGGYSSYITYAGDLNDIHADKDANGKSINGSRKEKVLDYINNLDADYHTKIILYKSEYPADDTYNSEIVNYINNRSDLSYDERVAILTELGFRVTADGQIYDD